MGKRYTKKQFRAAITNSGGVILTVAQRLGCAWQTARDRIQADPALSAQMEAERAVLLDEAEQTIRTAIQAGDVATAKWVAARLGKDRGWGDSELTFKAAPVDLIVTYAEPLNEREEK